MERDTGIKYEPGVKYKCVNSEVGGLCGQTIDCVRKQMMVSVPHRHIGAVICVGPGGSVQYGSGTLISKNLVLTCAHVIFNWQHRAYYNQIIFYPALSGEMKIWHLVQNFEAPEQYGENNMDQSKQYDYALLKLKEPVKQEEQFLELSEDPSVITEDDILSIYGYPVSRYDTENGKPFAAKQYGLKRQAYILDFALEEGYIIHRISTESGQSGSPVIKTNESGKMTIIGIHIGSTAEDIQKYQDIYSDLNKVNLTKVLNKMIVKNLKSFADKLNGQTFKVQNEEKNTSSLVENKMSLQRRQKLPREKYFPKKIEQKTAEQYFIEATCHHKAKRYEDAVERYIRYKFQQCDNYKQSYDCIN